MKFTLEIELGNDAMQTYHDLRKALEYARKTMVPDSPAMMRSHSEKPRVGEGTGILDMNGNTVGKWEVTDEPKKNNCEKCGGKGWLSALPDGRKPPVGRIYVERCDACLQFAGDIEAAADAFPGAIEGLDEYGVLCVIA